MNSGMMLYFKDLASLRKKDKNGNPVVTGDEFMNLIFGLMDHAEKGEEPEWLSPACQIAYDFMVQKLDRDLAKYNAYIENGKKGGRPKNQAKPNKTKTNQTITKQNQDKPNPNQENLNVNVNVNENVDETVCVKEGSEHTNKPTLEEVKEFIKAEGLEAIPEDFFNYYQACNWMRGKNPIDWKAACRFWKNRGGIVPISAGRKRVLPAQNFQQRDYTEDEMRHYSNDILNEIISSIENGKPYESAVKEAEAVAK